MVGHDRFEYSGIADAERPTYDFPDGKKFAVYIGLNLEQFSFGEGLGGELVPHNGEGPDVLNYSWREYGNRVGAHRLLDLFDEVEMPVSVLANSALAEHCPTLLEKFVKRGDELVAHGRTNAERQGDLDEAGEAELIKEATSSLKEVTSKVPRGWLGPWISQSKVTPDLLAEQGYTYCLDWCMDDQPTTMRTRGGKTILALPYPQELNDVPGVMVRRTSASVFAEMIIDNFDEMLRQSKKKPQPLVMGIALHAYIAGQPFRLKHLRRALEHIAKHRDDVWIATAGDIADWHTKQTTPKEEEAPVKEAPEVPLADQIAKGLTAVECRDLGYGPAEIYEHCCDYPFNEEDSETYDDDYNKLSILKADGESIVTATSFGTMKVAVWSPDIYAAPPAWMRPEDGYDIRNKHKARRLIWKEK